MKPTHAFLLFAIIFATIGSGWTVLSGLAYLVVEEEKGRRQP